MSGAARARSYRHRQANGGRILRFLADTVATVELLLRTGDLAAADIDNPEAINRAAGRLWARLQAVDLPPNA